MTRFGELNNSMSIGSGVSNIGNTSGNTGSVSGQLILAGGNNITLSQSTNANGATITVSAPSAIGGADGYNLIAAGSQTANTTGTIVFSNSNGIIFGMSNSSIVTASHNGITAQTVESNTFGMSNLGNTAGTSGVVSGGQLAMYMAGGNNVTLSQSINGSSATISVIDEPIYTVSSLVVAPLNDANPFAQSSASLGQNTLYIYPFNLSSYVSVDHIKLPMMVTNSTSAANSGQKGQTLQVGLYSRVHTNTGDTGYTRLTLAYSSTYTIAASQSSNASFMISLISNIQNSTSYNSTTQSSTSSALSQSLHGPRYAIVPVSSVLTTGEWWFAMRNSTSGAGTVGNIMNISNILVAAQTFGRMAVATNATGTGFHRQVGMGSYSVTTGDMPTTINMTQIQQGGTGPIAFFVTGTE